MESTHKKEWFLKDKANLIKILATEIIRKSKPPPSSSSVSAIFLDEHTANLLLSYPYPWETLADEMALFGIKLNENGNFEYNGLIISTVNGNIKPE